MAETRGAAAAVPSGPGSGSGQEAGARGGSGCRPGLPRPRAPRRRPGPRSRGPLPGCGRCGPPRPPTPPPGLPGSGECPSRSPARPGPRPGCRCKLCRGEVRTRGSCRSGWVALPGPPSRPRLRLLPLGLHQARGLSRGSVGEGSPDMNESGHGVVGNAPGELQEGMSRAHRFRTRAGHAPASPCRAAGLISLGISPGGLVIPSSPLVFLSFYLGGRRGGSPHAPAQGNRDLWSFLIFGGLRVSLRWAVGGLRPPMAGRGPAVPRWEGAGAGNVCC